MSAFAVVRHPDVTVAGVLPAEALEVQRLRGWYRVSEFAGEPAELDPSAFGPDSPDLDAEPEPEPEPEPDDEPVEADASKPETARRPARTTKKESNA